MNKLLPERADLEHLKSQAKALLLSLRSGDADALSRAGEPQAEFRLADAQRIVAREYGFPSWTRLKRHVEGFEDLRVSFFRALRGGDRETVRKLLEQDRSLVTWHDADSFGASLISIAAERDDRPMVDLLLEFGADIDARSTWWAGSFGPLDLANESMSRYLLSRGATLTAHAAARLGMAEELKAILRANPDAVFERGGDGQYPLHFSKTPEVVDILVDAGSVLDARDLDHVSTAAQWRILEKDVCRRLIERGASPDVYMAIILDDLALLRALIEADPECLDRTPTTPGGAMFPEAPGAPIYTYNIGLGRPFQVAAKFGRTQAAALIAELSSPKSRFMAACWLGNRDAALALADQVALLTRTDQVLVAEAAWDRRTASVRLMLELGFDPNVAGVHDSTPIDRAAFHGFDDVIEAILPFGPDLTVRNEFGGMPLGACAYGSLHSWRRDGNFPRSIELLLAAGAPQPEKLKGSPEVNTVLEKHGISTS